jgi:hypothetical protein
MLPERTLDATEADFRCQQSGLYNATLKLKSTLDCHSERTLECDLKTEVDLFRTERTLIYAT